MGYSRPITQPAQEPVSLAEAKAFARVPISVDDALISGLIKAAREHAETVTGRCLAQRDWVMVLDSHPYYTDTIQSQLSYPPNYYSLPRYSTTLWNYSQMIKVPWPPLKSVSKMRSIQPDGTTLEMFPDVDFIVDRETEMGRIFPKPGGFWPADLYVANALEIFFTAGFDPNPAASPDVHTAGGGSPFVPVDGGQQPDSTVILAVPESIRTAIMMLVAHWYQFREVAVPGTLATVPKHIDALLWGNAVVDFMPTRG